MRSPSPHRITGTRSPASGRCKPGRTSTSRSQSRTTSGKAVSSLLRRGSTSESFRPARRFARVKDCARPSNGSKPAISARSSRHAASATNVATASVFAAVRRRCPRRSTTICGRGRRHSYRRIETPRTARCTTTGTGSTCTATATSAIKAFTRWTSRAGSSASRGCRSGRSASADDSVTWTTARRPIRKSSFTNTPRRR